MTEADIIQIVRSVIREEMAPILMGKLTEVSANFRASGQRFKGESVIENMRLIQPYGLASRPPAGMESVVEPVNGDPTHLNVNGQNDTNRPALAETESALYGPEGQVVQMMADGSIRQGSSSAAEPVVLGNTLIAAFNAILDAIMTATQIGECAVGPVMLEPSVRTALAQARQTFLDTADTNIVGQKNFVERT